MLRLVSCCWTTLILLQTRLFRYNTSCLYSFSNCRASAFPPKSSAEDLVFSATGVYFRFKIRISGLLMTSVAICALLSSGLPETSISTSKISPNNGSRSITLFYQQMQRLSLCKYRRLSIEDNLFLETSIILRHCSSQQIVESSSVKLLSAMFNDSSVVGRDHICSIQLFAIDSFFRNDNFFNSGRPDFSKLPLRSSSVKFLNFWISARLLAYLLTNLKEISNDGDLTSSKLLIAVVLEL